MFTDKIQKNNLFINKIYLWWYLNSLSLSNQLSFSTFKRFNTQVTSGPHQ